MIIQSLLDTDLYKLTMMQVVLHKFPGNMVEYTFHCRQPEIDLSPYADEIKQEIAYLCSLRFGSDELAYLRELYYLKNDFVDFLRIFQLNMDYIHIETQPQFSLKIRGPWLHTILFEVPILAIINEVYFRNLYPHPDYQAGRERLSAKIALLKNHPNVAPPVPYFKLSEFGTRRRFSSHWQQEVLKTLSKEIPDNLMGTSNVYLAKQFNLIPLGTMAHEYVQACQASGPRLVNSQKFAFEKWAQEYRGALGIALTDTVGIDAFLRDFDLYFCKLFDGVRHDSGDPFEWGEKMIAHYEMMKIDARTKTLVFSDSLNIPLALKLFDHFRERTEPVFGIGTDLTNDLGYDTLSIVMKMTECNGQPVAKISDEREKIMCKDPGFLDYLKKVFEVS